MNSISNLTTSELDEHFLRRSFDVARRAVLLHPMKPEILLHQIIFPQGIVH
jgi:hypothetical protein